MSQTNQMQYTFKPGDEVIITVPEGTLANEREPGGEYIDEDMLDWTEGRISPSSAEVTYLNSILVYNSDGSDCCNFPVSWLKLKNPPEEIQETKEKKLPDSFRFKTAARSDYKATWNESRSLFIISWDDGANSTPYNKDYAEECVQYGYWTIIEEIEVQPVEQGTEATEDPQEQEITLEEINKMIAETDSALTHLYNIKDAIKSCKALGYKIIKT